MDKIQKQKYNKNGNVDENNKQTKNNNLNDAISTQPQSLFSLNCLLFFLGCKSVSIFFLSPAMTNSP